MMTSTTTNSKTGQVRILATAAIRPSPENAQLYRPVDPDDPDVLALAESVREHGIQEPLKVALTPDQVRRFQLPPMMEAKRGSANYAKFAERHGNHVYELEALNPTDLQQVLRDAIESVIDRDALNHEIAAEKMDAADLDVMRRRIKTLLADMNVEGGQR